MEKIEVDTTSKPAAADQPSSVPTNSKPPIAPLKKPTQNNKDDFSYISTKFKPVISIKNQNKQSSFTPDSNNVSNPDIEIINQTRCLPLASENKSETSKTVAIDALIDELIEGKETIFAAERQTDDSVRIILQNNIESRSLLPFHVLRFDGNPSKCPEFIDNFKRRVHMKVIFNDSVRMEKLNSVWDGDTKKAISSIGINSIFYAAPLKTLKREFGHPAVVANLKLKALFDQPQIHSFDRVALRNYHQQLKCTTTWFTSMDYQSAIYSTEKLTKAV